MIIKNKVYDLVKNDLSLISKYLLSIGASKEDMEDIIQETFIKVYENIDILLDGNIKAWMFKVSVNKFYSLYKRSKFNKEVSENLIENIKSDFDMSTVENNIDIKRVFTKISESQKNILILKYSMGLSYREIGKLLNIDEGSSKTLCYRARKKFKEVWEGENIYE
ncbi:MAG: sigma-70 family RNA polymerase sigma factor [Clostridium sp.]|uniref:RNA polymerase sigma factor n=1 Tax=Clostridium sp. TaxID=1506 RepID=UPI0025C2A978|nr:sigma-70 family RNA polymerase sigma factor [Clostridium sp.]MCF0149433.1 sigma-70 family RNA polymerase sigma factor [Clostridium sp.]